MRILYLAGKCETYIQLNCIKCTRAWKFIYLNRQVALWHKHTLRKLINFVQLCFHSHWCLSLQRANESKTCVNCFLKDLGTHISEEKVKFKENRGCRDGAVVRALARALASHQCGPGSIPRTGVKCGLSLLVLFSATRGFLRELRFPLSSKDHHLTWFVLIVNLSLQCPQLVLQR